MQTAMPLHQTVDTGHCLFLLCKIKYDVPVHTMNTYRGSGGISPLILNSASRWR